MMLPCIQRRASNVQCLFSSSHFNNSKYQNFQYLSTFKMSSAPIWIFPLWVFIKSRRTSKCALFYYMFWNCLDNSVLIFDKRCPKHQNVLWSCYTFKCLLLWTICSRLERENRGTSKSALLVLDQLVTLSRRGLKMFIACNSSFAHFFKLLILRFKMLGKVCWESGFRRGRVAMLWIALIIFRWGLKFH